MLKFDFTRGEGLWRMCYAFKLYYPLQKDAEKDKRVSVKPCRSLGNYSTIKLDVIPVGAGCVPVFIWFNATCNNLTGLCKYNIRETSL